MKQKRAWIIVTNKGVVYKHDGKHYAFGYSDPPVILKDKKKALDLASYLRAKKKYSATPPYLVKVVPLAL